jgi:hypothetical protein
MVEWSYALTGRVFERRLLSEALAETVFDFSMMEAKA